MLGLGGPMARLRRGPGSGDSAMQTAVGNAGPRDWRWCREAGRNTVAAFRANSCRPPAPARILRQNNATGSTWLGGFPHRQPRRRLQRARPLRLNRPPPRSTTAAQVMRSSVLEKAARAGMTGPLPSTPMQRYRCLQWLKENPNARGSWEWLATSEEEVVPQAQFDSKSVADPFLYLGTWIIGKLEDYTTPPNHKVAPASRHKSLWWHSALCDHYRMG